MQGGHTDEWVECAKGHVGSYPMFLRPAGEEPNCNHTLEIVRNQNELRSWLRVSFERKQPFNTRLIPSLGPSQEPKRVC